MTQTFRGNIPRAEDWMHLHTLRDEETDWLLFFRGARGPDDKGWVNGKLLADGRAPRKANYWLSWRDGRLARHRDAGTLSVGRPALYSLLEEFLNPKGRTDGDQNA